jgi:hypothetical protein
MSYGEEHLNEIYHAAQNMLQEETKSLPLQQNFPYMQMATLFFSC